MKPFSESEARRIAHTADLTPFASRQNELHQATAAVLCEEAEKIKCPGDALLFACVAFALGRATGIREERARRHKMMKTYRGNAAERI